MAADGVEQELKYRVANATAATRLAGARTLGPFRAAGRARVVQLEDRYLDTADGALGRAGWAVRLRHGSAKTLLSVKSTTPPTGALHRREELEGPADLSLDPRAWPPSPARSLVLDHIGRAPLRELVTIRQQRRTRTLADASTEVELSLDEVTVVADGEVVDRFVELEVELMRGPAAALDVLAAFFAGGPRSRARAGVEARAGPWGGRGGALRRHCPGATGVHDRGRRSGAGKLGRPPRRAPAGRGSWPSPPGRREDAGGRTRRRPGRGGPQGPPVPLRPDARQGGRDTLG